jgi:hypothetical protein
MNDSNDKYQLRFIFRHIMRQRVKTLLAAIIALFFVLAPGYLQTAIESTELEVDHLYATTIVTGEIRQADLWSNAPGRFHQNVIRQRTLEDVTPYITNESVVACHEFAVLTTANEDDTLPENWDKLAGIHIDAHLTDSLHAYNTLIGVTDLELFVHINSHRVDDKLTGFFWEPVDEVGWITNWMLYHDNDFLGLQINFTEGFDPDDFVLTDNNPVPIIVSNRVMGMRGYEFGDIVYLGTSTMLRSWEWDQTPAVIVGTYNLGMLTNNILYGTIVPIDALRHIVGNELRYMLISFEIDPVFNREMQRIKDELEEIVEHSRAGEVPLMLFLNDEELRMVVIPMEQNLSLLRLLYPVAITLSAIIGVCLSVLLMQQNAKAAAIMRVLGTTKTKSRTTLCLEQILVCIVGLVIGLAVLAVLDWGFGFASSLSLAGVYLAGAAVGTVVGAVVVTNKPPLELLQVKE